MAPTVHTDIRTPNRNPAPITVELLVLHGTAADRDTTLRLLTDPAHNVSAHLVVAEDGVAYELVPCLSAPAQRAWHAGRSRWSDGDRTWESLNDWAIGIELVNLNGNLIAYSDAQYAAVAELLGQLRQRYPTLDDPNRIVGHEHVAGFRGKVDPGRRFDWSRVFAEAYPGCVAPSREPTLPVAHRNALRDLVDAASPATRASTEFWTALSALTELCCASPAMEPWSFT
jgi:N-acetyl-anhydromuramyl-L-alanine amidase AmpD